MTASERTRYQRQLKKLAKLAAADCMNPNGDGGLKNILAAVATCSPLIKENGLEVMADFFAKVKREKDKLRHQAELDDCEAKLARLRKFATEYKDIISGDVKNTIAQITKELHSTVVELKKRRKTA